MLLDEFTALGRIPIIAEAISYLPGYNVRVVLVIQTPAQLREVYGIHNAEAMLKSLAARIVFAPKDFADAREISDELGFTTVRARSVSTPIGIAFDRRSSRSRSQSVSEQRRALLLPQEVKELGTGGGDRVLRGTSAHPLPEDPLLPRPEVSGTAVPATGRPCARAAAAESAAAAGAAKARAAGHACSRHRRPRAHRRRFPKRR